MHYIKLDAQRSPKGVSENIFLQKTTNFLVKILNIKT